MDSRTSWLAIAAVLAVALLAGCSAVTAPGAEANAQTVTVTACDSLPTYDYARMVERVEEIKGMELRRNLSICVEQSDNGIDTTPDQRQFAHVTEPGLSFFGLGPTANSGRRSSLGYTEFSLTDGPIKIFLANDSVVENVTPWVSYEGLVAHELSHAIDISHLRQRGNGSIESVEVRRTTDWLLANQAVREGSATYVSKRYVRKYGGKVNVSELAGGNRNWKHQLVAATYLEGYTYSKVIDITSGNERRVNSTAEILHPEESQDPSTLPARPNLSIESLERVRTDRIGELFLRETLETKGISPARAAAAADGWTNDRMDYYRANGSTVVTWSVTWQNADERTEFVETYASVYRYEQVESLRSISCDVPGRYLAISKKTVTVVECGS